ncbi:MAG: indolepyruvate oxidoreductase subunit beta [Clostridiales bacterium]|nr:indolepyruvate oxidoreductase subunit beta [Clostridiales bacterium]
MSCVTNILIAGVGGQGTILAGRIISLLALEAGHTVKVSEVHGMSQRGGSVLTQVRYGDEVYSPLIDPGEADILLAFEKLEALRMLPLLKPQGRALVNAQELPPLPVLSGAMEYPADIDKCLQATSALVTMVDAYGLALKAGNGKAVNTVLLGKLSQSLEFSLDAWQEAISKAVKPQFAELNLRAFDLGRGV